MKEIIISKKIKDYRRSKDLTQENFAALIGVSPQAVSKWERVLCYPDITLLPVLAEIMQCSVGDFFENT